MSTRAKITIKDGYEEVYFYRHSDGYPSGTMHTLKKFIDWIVTGRIRKSASLSAGWLVLIGAEEYRCYGKSYKNGNMRPKKTVLEPGNDHNSLTSWKCGSYEPCGEPPGDYAYAYLIDLEKDTLTISHDWPEKSKTITFKSALRRKWKNDKV